MGALNHIEIYVSNLQKTRDFWAWLFGELGWAPYQEFTNGFSFRREGTYIVFVQTEDKHLAAGYHRGRTGLNHLAFSAPDRASVDRLAAQLKDRNVTMLYADRHPDKSAEIYAVYFEDPDRIKVEFAAAR